MALTPDEIEFFAKTYVISAREQFLEREKDFRELAIGAPRPDGFPRLYTLVELQQMDDFRAELGGNVLKTQEQVKELIKLLPEDRKENVEKFADAVTNGWKDKELGLNPYTPPGIEKAMERDRELDEPKHDFDANM